MRCRICGEHREEDYFNLAGTFDHHCKRVCRDCSLKPAIRRMTGAEKIAYAIKCDKARVASERAARRKMLLANEDE